MKVFGLAGWSGAGKTTLVCALIPALTRRGLRVSTLKHAHHAFDIDTPGKDSYEHRRAGATEVMVASANRWAIVHELRGEPEPASSELIRRMTSVDLLLIEGYKQEAHDKLEIHRPSLGKPLLCTGDPHVVAVASDAPLPELCIPRLDLNDVEAIAAFIVAHCGLDGRARGAA
ncbi:MAG TPA: molybdopterin-guanine dinucleotide biosynthesis protein B [Kiloniellales bacterium]